MADPVARLEAWCDKKEFAAQSARSKHLTDAYRKLISEYWTAQNYAQRQLAAGENNVLWAVEAQTLYRTAKRIADALNPEKK